MYYILDVHMKIIKALVLQRYCRSQLILLFNKIMHFLILYSS